TGRWPASTSTSAPRSGCSPTPSRPTSTATAPPARSWRSCAPWRAGRSPSACATRRTTTATGTTPTCSPSTARPTGTPTAPRRGRTPAARATRTGTRSPPPRRRRSARAPEPSTWTATMTRTAPAGTSRCTAPTARSTRCCWTPPARSSTSAPTTAPTTDPRRGRPAAIVPRSVAAPRFTPPRPYSASARKAASGSHGTPGQEGPGRGSVQRRAAAAVAGRGLEGGRVGEQGAVAAVRADQLHADRQPAGGEPAGHRDRRAAGGAHPVAGGHPGQVVRHRHPRHLRRVLQAGVERRELADRQQQHVEPVEEGAEPVVQLGERHLGPAHLPAAQRGALGGVGRHRLLDPAGVGVDQFAERQVEPP